MWVEMGGENRQTFGSNSPYYFLSPGLIPNQLPQNLCLKTMEICYLQFCYLESRSLDQGCQQGWHLLGSSTICSCLNPASGGRLALLGAPRFTALLNPNVCLHFYTIFFSHLCLPCAWVSVCPLLF